MIPSASLSAALQAATQHHAAGRFVEAERLYRQVLSADPNQGDALYHLALIARQFGSSQAMDLHRRAVAVRPFAAEFHAGLGQALFSQSLFVEAVAAFQNAAQIRPDVPQHHHDLALALLMAGRAEEAIPVFERSIQMQPGLAVAHHNLGLALNSAQQFQRAATSYRTALRLQPSLAVTWVNLGNALREIGPLSEAIEAYEQALRLQPDFALAHNNLGDLCKDQGRVEEAVTHFREAVRLDPHSATMHSNLLATLHYASGTTPAMLLAEHREYDRRHTAPLLEQSVARTPTAGPARLGFTSPHFTDHPVSRFLLPLLENIDRHEFTVVCYSDSHSPDESTARIRAASHVWRETASSTDADLAQQVRDDKIDILFDLAGHTAGHRLAVFARKPAPIQITWLDYVGTTGLSAMDYLIADPREIPAESEVFYQEKVLRLPDDYICYDPPRDAPAVAPLPTAQGQPFTFGSFNILEKTTPEVIATWAEILRRLPGARLRLMNKGLDEPSTAARYRALFAAENINRARVEMIGRVPANEVLARYHQIDVALDTFPYNGGLTTCEALWMGVPVVTLPGEIFAARHGLAHLTAAGFADTIARDREHYIELALALAQDLDRLATIRATLRQRVAASPLCDGPRFAAHFARMLHEVSRRHRAGEAPAAFDVPALPR